MLLTFTGMNTKQMDLSHLLKWTLCLWLSLYAGFSCAETGKLLIEVTSASNQRQLEGVQILLTSRSNERFTATTNTQGRANLENLTPGLYELITQINNYKTLRLPSVRITVDKTTPITLEMATSKGNIEEVVVIGAATASESLKSVGTNLKDREALRSAAGSGSDVLRALDGLPGLFSDGEYSSYSVRGNGPRDNLILVDGIPFANVVHFSSTFGDQEEIEGGGRYSVFAPNTISSAKFQPGGWSASYGGRAGSLLELEVAEGNPETAAYTARLDIAGIEIGYDGPTGRADTSVLFSARQLNFGRLFETIGIDDIGTPELTDVILKTTTQLSDNNKLNFLLIYAPEEYQRDMDNVLASVAENPGNYAGTELVETESDNTLIGATWTHLIGANGELTSQLYYRHFSEQTISGEAYPDLAPQSTAAENIPQRPNILNSYRNETELGLRVDFAVGNTIGRLSTGVRIKQLELDFGLSLNANWLRYVYDQNDFRPDPNQQFIELTPEFTNSNYKDNATHYALYADQEWEWGNLDFRAGARYERDNFSDQDLLAPRFAATWYLGNNLQLTSTGGRYHQTPRFNDRASDKSNGGLENETIDQLSLGIKYKLSSDLELFIEPYYQDLSNLVVKQDSVNQTLANTGEGRSYGVDTAISRYFSSGWSASFTYSYNEAQVKDAPQQAFYDASFSRPHAVSIGGVWEINTRWKLSGRWKLASGKPTDAYVVNANVLGDGNPLRFSKEIIATNTERFDTFNSVNFRLDYRRNIGRFNVIAFLDVINALGSDNPSNIIFNERTGLNIEEDGQAIPLIGLRLEW